MKLNGSIEVNSADFNETKLLTTERRHLYNAEIQREKVNMANGSWLQTRINTAKPNEVIQLQEITYKFTSLYINSPVTLVGQPETILEVDGGSIFIDFRAITPKDMVDDGDDAQSYPTPGGAETGISEAAFNQAIK